MPNKTDAKTKRIGFLHGGLGIAIFAALSLQSVNAASVTTENLRKPISWAQIQSTMPPQKGKRIAYGALPSQFGELLLPPGKGPFPVVILLHGGCWLRDFDLVYFRHLAAALTREFRVATWNVEYRRLGQSGGGWPGTLQDVAIAADYLREIAPTYALDTSRVISLGHSAGGQLALWLAARQKLHVGSALYVSRPLALRSVIGLAAIADLADYSGGLSGCNAAARELMGGDKIQRQGRYAQASPRALLPLGTPQWLVQGSADPIVPAASVRRYVQAAKASGDTVKLLLVQGAEHFDPAMPGSMAWPAIEQSVREALQE